MPKFTGLPLLVLLAVVDPQRTSVDLLRKTDKKSSVGASVGAVVVGAMVGWTVGDADGCIVGCAVGAMVGAYVGAEVGDVVGALEGVSVGVTVGRAVGVTVGWLLGAMVGVVVGGCVGAKKVVHSAHRLHDTGQSMRNTSPKFPTAEHSAAAPVEHVKFVNPLDEKCRCAANARISLLS